MPRTGRFAGTILIALGLPVSAAAEQAPVLGLTMGGGQATDLRGVGAGAVSLMPSLMLFPSPNTLLTFSGRGTRFGSGVWSAGGSTGFLTRAPLSRRLTGLLQATGDATYASWRTTYLQAELQPALELSIGAFRLSGGVKGAAARTSYGSESPLPGLVPPSDGSTPPLARSGQGPVWGASAKLVEGGGSELGVRYREERLTVGSTRIIDRIGSGELRHGPITLTGSLAWRHAPAESPVTVGMHLSVLVTRGVALLAAAESYPSNPLTESMAGRSISLGVALRSGGIRPARALPRPAGTPAPPPGFTRLAIRDLRARTMEAAGDWNRWTPIRMIRTANGVWYADVKIAPGEYRYAFRVDGSTWTVPEDVAAVDDGFGGRSAWLSVQGAGPKAGEPATFKEDS